MLEMLKGLFESLRDPVLIALENRIVFKNRTARELGRGIELPEEFYEHPVPFSGALSLCGRSYQVTASSAGEYRVYMMYLTEFVNKNLMASAGASIKDSVTTMQMVANVLKNNESGDISGKYQAMLYHSIHSVNRIAGNMLYLGGADYASESGLFDLVELYGDLTDSVNVLTNGRTAKVVFVSAVNALKVEGSRSVYERMILNLLSNSLKSTAKTGKVTVTLTVRGSNAIITVSDNGRGIAPDILTNLFSSYTVERSLGESYQAVGMGLPVVQGLVHSLNGTIMAVSEEGLGTRITVSIPISGPADLTLRSPSADYSTKAIGILLTELSEVLDSDSYSDIFRD